MKLLTNETKKICATACWVIISGKEIDVPVLTNGSPADYTIALDSVNGDYDLYQTLSYDRALNPYHTRQLVRAGNNPDCDSTETTTTKIGAVKIQGFENDGITFTKNGTVVYTQD